MSKYPPAIAAQKKRNNQSEETSFNLGQLWNRISEKEVIDFTRSLAVMVKAKMPLVKALDTAIEQTDNASLKEVLLDIKKDVEGGSSLAKSLSGHTDVFDSLYVHLVEVGEIAGILGEILLRLASYMEKRYSLKQKVRMAMVYPSLVLTVALGAMTFLLLFIVPTFAEMYNDFDAELPAPTQLVLSVSRGLSDYFLLIVLAIAGIGYGLYVYSRSPDGRYMLDRLKLKIPFFGSLYQKTLMTRFCQTLGTLLRSGITLVEALKIIRQASDNMLVGEATENMLQSVKRGDSLTKSLEGTKVFTGMVVQMVTVGEETAELDAMLLHIASLYEEETDMAVEGLTSIIEPVLIIILGIVLGGIIIAMYLPIFELMNVIR